MVSGTLTLDGRITVNGGAASGSTHKWTGGSSGGSIYIVTHTLTGSGVLQANGGGTAYASPLYYWAGGGGRIAVHYQLSTFTGTAEAKGGAGRGGRLGGEDGTVGFFDDQNAILYVGHAFRFQDNDSPFEYARVVFDGSTATIHGDLTVPELEVGNGSSLRFDDTRVDAGSVAIDASSVELVDQTALTVSGSAHLSSAASLRFQGAQTLSVPLLAIDGGSTLTLSGEETLSAGEITLTGGSTVTHLSGRRVSLQAEDISIDATSSIVADEKGYSAQQGPGASPNNRVGASYGGSGFDGESYKEETTYGSALAPVELGSGSWQKAGGGAVQLVVSGTLTLDGRITANGGNAAIGIGSSGGSSGGSIYVITNALAGSGMLQANGGKGHFSYVYYGAGGGGRIAVYYQSSTFTGTAEAKGGVGRSRPGGQDGTVILLGEQNDMPLTFFNLTEKSSISKTYSETILTQQVATNDVIVSGDLTGTLDFTDFRIVTVTSGSFSDKGFFDAQWEADLDGVTYNGTYKGAMYPNPQERKIHLDGMIEGDLKGIAESVLTESILESGTFDKFQSSWYLNRATGAGTFSLTLGLESNLSYLFSDSHTSQIQIYQGNFDGSCIGHYSGPIDAVVTQLLITEEGEYINEGYSIISYNTRIGSGSGWFYINQNTPGVTAFRGLFNEPLVGAVAASLNSNKPTKTLLGTIERLDLGLPAMADLEVRTWGPRRASPGQTIDYIVEVQNNGVASAENVVVTDWLPSEVQYISSTENGIYKWETHEVFWKLGTMPPKSRKVVSARVELEWGLPAGQFSNRAMVGTTSEEKDSYLTGESGFCGDISDYLNYEIPPAGYAELVNSDEWKDFLQNPDFEDIYLYAQGLGFNSVEGDSTTIRIRYEDGSLFIAPIMLSESSEDVLLAADLIGTDGESWTFLVRYSQDSVSLIDKQGGVSISYDGSIDLLSNAFFAKPTRAEECLAGCNKWACIENCQLETIVGYVPLFGCVHDCGLTIVDCVGTIFEKERWRKCISGWGNCGLSCFCSNLPGDAKTLCPLLTFKYNVWKCNWICEADNKAFGCGAYSSVGDSRAKCRRNGRQPCLTYVAERCGEDCAWDIIDAEKKYCEQKSWTNCKDRCCWCMGDNPFESGLQGGCDCSGSPQYNEACQDARITPAGDPNMKYGPEGDILPGHKLSYRVEFENEGEGIAFGVYFTDILDEDLDDSTLEIGPVISTADGTEIAPTGTYNPDSRTITWLVGEVGPSEGGYADISVNVRSDAPYGTEVINFATVYFPSVPEETPTNGIVNTVRWKVDTAYDFPQLGWHLVSLPVQPENDSTRVLFPTSLEAYEWNGNVQQYLESKRVALEQGYWLALPAAVQKTVTGYPLEGYNRHLSTGWHLIGSLQEELSINDLVDDPDGAIFVVYGWDPTNQTYYETATLEPGKGYWVGVLQSCELTIGTAEPSPKIVQKGGEPLAIQAFYEKYGSMPPPPPSKIDGPQQARVLPLTYELYQSYPNPFNPETVIRFALPELGQTRLDIYNALGQHIRALIDEELPAGYHRARWDGRTEDGLPAGSGVYLYRIISGSYVQTKKMVMLR